VAPTCGPVQRRQTLHVLGMNVDTLAEQTSRLMISSVPCGQVQRREGGHWTSFLPPSRKISDV